MTFLPLHDIIFALSFTNWLRTIKRYYGQSLGSIFNLLSSQAQEENIIRYLLEIFWEIITGIDEILKVDCWELFEEIIRNNQKAEEIMRIFSPVLEKKLIA